MRLAKLSTRELAAEMGPLVAENGVTMATSMFVGLPYESKKISLKSAVVGTRHPCCCSLHVDLDSRVF